MPKHKPTAAARAKEFANEGFYVNDGKLLMCKICDCLLEYDRKDTLNKHILSEKHRSGKLRKETQKRQLTIGEAGPALKRVREIKEDFVLETVEAFLGAGIPIEKFDNSKLKEWMGKHVSSAGDLPTADWIRKKYVPMLRARKEEEIKDMLAGQAVAIMADETTDKSNNCIFNILFKILLPGAEQKCVLGASCVLEAANGVTCSKAVVDICSKYQVHEENIVAYVTDGASYMTKSATTLQGIYGEHMNHVQCWAHKINLVGQIWQNNLEELNHFVGDVKNGFLNTRKRRHAYLEFLSNRHGKDAGKVKLFPMPVVTRWNSWFESVSYLALYLHDIIDFFEELSQDNNSGVRHIRALQESAIQCIEAQCVFVAENCAVLVELINFLEGSSYPSAHLLFSRVGKLRTALDVLSKGILPERVEELLSQMKSVQSGALKEQFKNTSKLSLLKLCNLITCDPSQKLFQGIDALFNPKNIQTVSVEDKQFFKYAETLPFLQKVPKIELASGYMALQKLVSEEQKKAHTNHIDILDLLCRLKCDYPQFGVAGLKLIWIPTSNVDTERSFSKYSFIVNDRRRSLLPENAELLTMVAFS